MVADYRGAFRRRWRERLESMTLEERERVRAGVWRHARCGREIIGTCALLQAGDGRCEVSKMAVTDGFKGHGIGRQLLSAVIGEFKALDGDVLFLETNSILKPAIALYESAGFVHSANPSESPYTRSDVYMVYQG